jgi:tetratricopeptide (TPR) repeat protein
MTLRWQLTEEIFNESLNLSEAQRSTYLTEVCGSDDALRKEVESLLAYASGSESYLQCMVDETARDLRSSLPFVEGARIGPYVILREIGRGGMGTVYLAARADGQFEQKVALKVINMGIDPGFALEYFLHERQVLANLQHANIARLLDGGTTESGQPYFAMEYLEGEPLTEYFSRCRPGLSERLKIFEQVCSAIHYAHQQLVIHRDLKPDNVLVTKEGVAKLLDFGIARLLGPAPKNEIAGERFLSPFYASPEQFRGESSGTACDVYSLGAVLYEVVSGRRPFDFQGKSPSEIENMICSQYPQPLPGDLGRIVRKAMDKDPARRYASAEALADDLRRYSGGFPVRAHEGGPIYRMRRFVVRNRILSGVGAILLVLIVAATALIVHEENLAWHRAGQVRDLAESLLTGFNETGDAPESTAQRAQRVRHALDSLGQLSAGTGKDAALDLKIAIAYEHVGDVQGDPLRRSLGDSAGAERSYRAAVAILERLVARREQLPASERELLQADYRLAMLLRESGVARESLDYFVRAARMGDAATAQSPKDLHLQNDAGVIYEAMSRVLATLGRDGEAVKANTHAFAIFEKLTRGEPGSQDFRDGLANSYAERGSLACKVGSLQACLKDYKENLRIREALATEFPNSASAQRNLMLAYSRLADVLGYPGLPNLGDPEAAAGYLRKCLSVAQAISAADPTDQNARFDITMARLRLARTLLVTKAPGEALGILRSGSAETERLLAADPQNKRYLLDAIMFGQMLGDQFRDAGDDPTAIAEYERALASADRLRAHDPSYGGQWLGCTVLTLIPYSHVPSLASNRARAASIEKRMIELANWASRVPVPIGQSQAPMLYAALGEMHLAFGEKDQGRAWFEKSAELWQKLQAGVGINPLYAKEPARVAALLARTAH